MKPHYADDDVTLYAGDCVEVMRGLPDCSVDAVVTDPPYGLEFMGKEWDAPWKAAGDVVSNPADVGGFQDGNGGNPYSRSRVRYGIGSDFQAWCAEWATEALRVLKPGGHLVAFGGTRTWHRLACAIEDAGFEIRDCCMFMYGSGFPKSLDVSKAIDKAAGPATPAAQQWQGWGTALKPAYEPIVWARKPLTVVPSATTRAAANSEGLSPAYEPIVLARKPLAGTVAGNVLAWGTGALNIDGCRVASGDAVPLYAPTGRNGTIYGDGLDGSYRTGETSTAGRWPANVLLDEAAAAMLDAQSGESVSRSGERGAGKGSTATYGEWGTLDDTTRGHNDSGGASRFFYTSKAGRDERPNVDGVAHATVKPLDLMRWLVRLVTPPGGVVLEPFAGSGTTAEACVVEGFRCIAIEREADYLPLIVQRLTKPIERTLL